MNENQHLEGMSEEMEQKITNTTRKHEVAGSIPDLAKWVKDPALP